MDDRSHFNALFEPRSIAFIGASASVTKWGFNILHHLVKGGFEGGIYPVNPQGGAWFGRKIYTSLAEVPRPVDLAIIVVPKELVPGTMRECAAAGIRAAVVITAGFSETGAGGAALEREVVSIARETGIRIVGPNTMGIFSAFPSPVQAVMMSTAIRQGGVAVVSQSGNLGTSITYRFNRREIGISRLVSSGNEADMKVEDYLEYLESDDATRIICLYVEGLRQGRRFIDTARRITLTKPIILLKGGTGSIGAGAAMSHTGALAGSFSVFQAMCRQANIILAETIDEMVDVAGFLLTQPEVTGKRVGIVTQGGGWGVITADLCEAAGLELPPLDEKVVAELDGFLPPFWSRRNPIDLVAPGRVSMVTDSIAALLEHADMDAIICLGLGYMTARARRWLDSPVLPRDVMEKPARQMIDAEMELLDLVASQIRRFNKPIIPVIDLVAFDEVPDVNIVSYLDGRGIMSYSSPEQAVGALVMALEYYRKRGERVARDGA
ncbi:MAG TPA: CoA-binding protein [Spirochaetota bacterium]|nr:CoA-binding protein [Spirochaetota bacterium]